MKIVLWISGGVAKTRKTEKENAQNSIEDQEKNSIFQLQLKSFTNIIRNIALAC